MKLSPFRQDDRHERTDVLSVHSHESPRLGKHREESRGHARGTGELLLNESRVLFEMTKILDTHADGGTSSVTITKLDAQNG